MTWIVIIIILLAAIGPIMWMRPSAKDRRLSALRQRAREENLIVEILVVEKPFATPEERVSQSGIIRPATKQYVVYAYPLEKRLRFNPRWRLVKVGDKKSDRTLGPIPGWLPEARIVEPAANFWERVAKAVKRLPQDTEIFELTERFVRCYWQEGKGADPALVSALAEGLRTFAADMVMLEEKLAREVGDDS